MKESLAWAWLIGLFYTLFALALGADTAAWIAVVVVVLTNVAINVLVK